MGPPEYQPGKSDNLRENDCHLELREIFFGGKHDIQEFEEGTDGVRGWGKNAG